MPPCKGLYSTFSIANDDDCNKTIKTTININLLKIL